MTDKARAQVAALQRRRRWCDIVGLLSLLIMGSNAMWIIGYGASWPLGIAFGCVLAGSIAMVIRSRLTKRIWALEPPAKPLHERAWPDGT